MLERFDYIRPRMKCPTCNPRTETSFATVNVVSRPGRNVASHSLWKNPPKSLSSIVKLRPSIASSLAARLIATPCGQASEAEMTFPESSIFISVLDLNKKHEDLENQLYAKDID